MIRIGELPPYIPPGPEASEQAAVAQEERISKSPIANRLCSLGFERLNAPDNE